jgi:hypothetical protein
MTQPDPPPPPETIGLQPINAAEVNNKVGRLLQDFKALQARANSDRAFLDGTFLTQSPYWMTPEQETAIKSGVGALDDGFDAIDMTFINRLTGLS